METREKERRMLIESTLKDIYNGNWEHAVYLVTSYDISFRSLLDADSVYKVEPLKLIVLADMVREELNCLWMEAKGVMVCES